MTSTESKASSSTSSTSDHLKYIRFITWNIDGISKNNIQVRTEAVSNILNEENANIVFLQEVVPFSENFLLQNLPQYQFFSGNSDVSGYYTLTLIHKDSVKLVSNEIIEFEESFMGRNLLKTRVIVGNTAITLLNTHLESTRDFSEIRVKQLIRAFEIVYEIPKTDTVIFAGDLNIRDGEVRGMGGLPLQVKDIWVKTGSREETRYTWDMMLNDNMESFNRLEFKPRLRFDRVYTRESTPAKLDAFQFSLIGWQRLKSHLCFPSDHWGILCYFRIL